MMSELFLMHDKNGLEYIEDIEKQNKADRELLMQDLDQIHCRVNRRNFNSKKSFYYSV